MDTWPGSAGLGGQKPWRCSLHTISPIVLIALMVVLMGSVSAFFVLQPSFEDEPCVQLSQMQPCVAVEMPTGAPNKTRAPGEYDDSNDWFVDPEKLGDKQLAFLGLVYMYMLYRGAEFMGGGAELLLLVPSLSGVVGSIIIPLSGSAPEGIMVIVSGIGEQEDVIERVKVGMGTIAGSIIFLLTLPWFVTIWCGSVSIQHGEAQYHPDRKGARGSLSFVNSGVGITDKVHKSARSLFASQVLYLMVQLPAFILEYRFPGKPDTIAKMEQLAEEQAPYTLTGIVAGVIAFVLYLRNMVSSTDSNDVTDLKREKRIIAGIANGQISLTAALSYHRAENVSKEALARIMHPFFQRYDKDHDGQIDFVEYEAILLDLGEMPDEESARKSFQAADTDGSGYIEWKELLAMFEEVLEDPEREHLLDQPEDAKAMVHTDSGNSGGSEDEEDEIPDDLAHLPPQEQQKRILMRATWMMIVGLILTFIFADPLVDVLAEAGRRLDISPFYTSFILAPLTSNATEVYTTYIFASKRTLKTVEASLSTLLGSSVMNNTFVYPLFLVIMYWRNLPWTFAAETISIIFTVSIISMLSMSRRVHTSVDALLILLLYPAGLLCVWVLTEDFGFD
mmetsp:Transcript_45089/g.107160  ORF Transcript_45089/g.107160 Transcript_45089/m.107160 type:complete len:619 (+) Transcript_45089:153-2009(+)|eukprot:CAMPEP_0178391768 /NCGR_PEP_ID=MMETSP0689_2-20121128/11334_1 /TAXON_ID=160604 /ORGANISM="Amphidinium massartii, Strain CS-259" /LENGTH=618 /DNA_ID=CAMNT_0020012323 /DNA_START=90 /DNA_END=1946 /DNA_ORIENTATION=+